MVYSRDLFLKSPETFRAYFGCHSSLYIFGTPRFSAIKPSNLLGFSYIKNMLKDQLFKTSGLQFDNWLLGLAKNSRDFRETGPRSLIMTVVGITSNGRARFSNQALMYFDRQWKMRFPEFRDYPRPLSRVEEGESENKVELCNLALLLLYHSFPQLGVEEEYFCQ